MKEREPIDWSLEPPSKSQRKRDMTALQKLGQDLTTLGKKQLEKLPLPDTLIAALAEYQRLPNSNEARRRQLQFIGRVMRDANHDEIQAELDKMRTPDRTQVRRAQLIEEWGDRLLDGEEDDINAFVALWPLAERQAIRQIVRNYSKDDEEAARVHRRRLMSYIKEYIE
jgi:ribosome-associated protein